MGTIPLRTCDTSRLPPGASGTESCVVATVKVADERIPATCTDAGRERDYRTTQSSEEATA